MNNTERKALARKRIISILTRQVVANLRTLEQKISDSGPYGQRIDPHILTPARQELEEMGIVQRINAASSTWYFLGNTPPPLVQAHLARLVADFKAFNKAAKRTGQALEIATYRALLSAGIPEFYGGYHDLTSHDDSTLYSQEQPPSHIGGRGIPKRHLDYIVRHPIAGHLGIECKNIREWLYPNREEIIETLEKCVAMDCVPVIIARRIPYVTFKLLNPCGVIFHETFNQLMAESDADAAQLAKRTDGLGYHDIRLGNQPDARLLKFIDDMMTVAPEARLKFNKFKDLLDQFGTGQIKYAEFAARVRRRINGVDEDKDEPDIEIDPDFFDF